MPHEKKGRGKGSKNGVLKIKPPSRKGFSPNPGSEAPNIPTESSPGKARRMVTELHVDDQAADVIMGNGMQTSLDVVVMDTANHYDDKEESNDDADEVENSQPVTFHKNESMDYECDICNFNTPYYSGIMSHALIHDGDSPYVCKVCGFTTERRGLMVIHMRMHKGFKPHKCHLCDYSTLQEMHLKVHVRTHKQDRPFKCQGCSYRCSSQDILRVHMLKYGHHTRIFKCDVCDYTTMRKHNLIQHTTIHTGAKPFKCDLCPYSSSQKGHLNVHIRTHTREKPFKCNYCPFASTVPKSLREHLQMHIGKRPLQCPYCSFSSSQAFSIKRHISLHEEIKKYTCSLCNFVTTVEDDFISHRQIHSQNKNYRCPKCSYESPFKHIFKEHLKTHKGSKKCSKISEKLDIKSSKKRKNEHTSLSIEFDEYKKAHPTELDLDNYGVDLRVYSEGEVSSFDDDDSDSEVAPFRVDPAYRPYMVDDKEEYVEAAGEKSNVPNENRSKVQEEKANKLQEDKMKTNRQKAAVINKEHIVNYFTCRYCDRKLVGQETWRRHTSRHFMEWPEIQ